MTTPTCTRPSPAHSGAPVAGRARRWVERLRPVRVLLPAALAAALIGWALPRAAGVHWSAIAAALAGIRPWWAPAAVLVWLAGLGVQTTVQRACLPGLSRGRAFLLNATGSAVSNLAPFGGALGVEANRRMLRQWGLGGRPFATYVLLINLVQLVTKLALPALLLAVATATGRSLGPVTAVGWTGLGALVVVGVMLSRRGPALALDRATEWAARVLRRRRTQRITACTDLRERSGELLARARGRVLVATAAYTALHGLGLWIAMHAVGSSAGPFQVLAALSVERAASLMLLTPAGAGVAEVAAAGVLVHFGADPAVAAAGLLLHRLIIVGLEVPLGATLGAAWWWRVGRRSGSRPSSAALAG